MGTYGYHQGLRGEIERYWCWAAWFACGQGALIGGQGWAPPGPVSVWGGGGGGGVHGWDARGSDGEVRGEEDSVVVGRGPRGAPPARVGSCRKGGSCNDVQDASRPRTYITIYAPVSPQPRFVDPRLTLGIPVLPTLPFMTLHMDSTLQ